MLAHKLESVDSSYHYQPSPHRINNQPISLQEYREHNRIVSIPQTPEADLTHEGGHPIHLLRGTGFDVPKQVNTIRNTLLSNLHQGKSFDTSVQGSLSQVRADIHGYTQEYLQGEAGIPFPLEETLEDDGTLNIRAKNYDNKEMTALTTDEERNGAVSRSLKEVKKTLLKLPVGGIVVRTSPPGWSGLTYEGKPYDYKETQTQIYQVVENNGKRSYRGMTIRSHMTTEENIELLAQLGKPESQNMRFIDEKTKLSFISEQFATLNQKQSFVTVPDIVKQISEMCQGKFYNNATLGDVLHNVQNYEYMLKLNDLTQFIASEFEQKAVTLFSQFQTDILSNGTLSPLMMKQLEKTLGMSILKLAQLYQNTSVVHNGQVVMSQEQMATIKYDPRLMQRDLRYLQSKPGCNGGGAENAPGTFVIQTPFGPRLIRFEGQKTRANPIDKDGTCSKCDGAYQANPRKVGLCGWCAHCEDKDTEESAQETLLEEQMSRSSLPHHTSPLAA